MADVLRHRQRSAAGCRPDRRDLILAEADEQAEPSGIGLLRTAGARHHFLISESRRPRQFSFAGQREEPQARGAERLFGNG